MSGSYNLDDALFGKNDPLKGRRSNPFRKDEEDERKNDTQKEVEVENYTTKAKPEPVSFLSIEDETPKKENYSYEEESDDKDNDLNSYNPSEQSHSASSSVTAIPNFSQEGRIVDNILRKAVEDGASDIHLSINSPALYRLDGDLSPVPGFEKDIITSAWMDKALKGIMNDTQYKEFKQSFEKDMSYTINNLSRFRVNAFHQRGSAASVFRVIPDRVLTLDELNIPEVIRSISKKPRGLVLVTGPTGSGKSTTLAAMIDGINKEKPDHIITIEDPIEFVHKNQRALVNQREIGADTLNFAEALKRVLRQDPDVILVGELRDPETISVALTAAETGHLVFGTLHTQSAAKTINRIIDSFPAHQQNQVRAQLSDTLQAVISQTLLKKKGGGRVMASEIMIRNSAIANNIREGKISSIYSALQSGAKIGMHTLDQNLVKLVSEGIVEKSHALPMMEYPESMDSISSSDDSSDW